MQRFAGSWLWLSGTGTFAVREGLKQLGFRYSPDKKIWYWRSQEDYCKGNHKPVSISKIHELYGASVIAM